ncbi:hypothetical protein [Flaviflexus huanghaiensis]|uniref:hypothetical protein n=1 Tax=Flaviflexus huanghaiensis TaxID=1111473 RepID=UPI0015FC603A|nr:hypothetical protein [Flaviflexus huanghaiensis]
MIRKLAATALIAVTGLAACSTDSEPDREQNEPTAAEETRTDEATGEETGQASDDNVMVVDDGIATTTDGRYNLTLADGWQAYPAPLDETVNMTVLLVSDVNNAEFAANIIGTWAPNSISGVPTTYEEWRSATGNVFTGEGVTVDEAESIEIEGDEIDGIVVSRDADGVEIRQVVYPIFAEDGLQEVAFSATPDVFDENLADAQEMFASLRSN